MATVTKMHGISFDDTGNGSHLSVTSYEASEHNSDQPRVPPIPSRNANGHMRCPLCHSMVMIDSLRAWEYGEPLLFPASPHIDTEAN